jgi:hypothetical protein
MDLNLIWDILKKHCGASEGMRENFLAVAPRYVAEKAVLEYRFQGMLGYGGKVWLNNGEHPYVNCYREDENRETLKMIRNANKELQKIKCS